MSSILRIGIAHRGAGLAPVFAAIATGNMERAGYQVQLIDVPGHPSALEALEAGEVDVINSVGIEVLRHNARTDGSATVIGSAIGRTAVRVHVAPGWPLDRPLNEARWGVLNRGDPDHCTIMEVFETEGWDVAALKLVVVPEVAGDRLGRLLQPDLVDAVVLHAPEPWLALRWGWHLAIDLARYDAPMQNSCAVVARRTIETRRALCLSYLDAYAEGVWRFRTFAAFGRRVLQATAPALDAEAVDKSWHFFARLMGGTIFPSRAGLRRAADLLVKAGFDLPVQAEPMDQSLIAELEARGSFARFMA